MPGTKYVWVGKRGVVEGMNMGVLALLGGGGGKRREDGKKREGKRGRRLEELITSPLRSAVWSLFPPSVLL